MNERWIEEVIIDPHYEVRHPSTVNDRLILDSIRTYLDDGVFPVDGVGSAGH